MDRRTKLVVFVLVLIVLIFIVISGLLAFTGPPSN
jgi:thiosulfate reductase cytochrome b subunit